MPSSVLHQKVQEPHDFRLMLLEIRTGEVHERHLDDLTIVMLIHVHITMRNVSVDALAPCTAELEYKVSRW